MEATAEGADVNYCARVFIEGGGGEMADIAKEVSTIGGIATVSVLHSFIPTHWLPFSIVGRAQKWTISQILLVSKFYNLCLLTFPHVSCISEGVQLGLAHNFGGDRVA